MENNITLTMTEMISILQRQLSQMLMLLHQYRTWQIHKMMYPHLCSNQYRTLTESVNATMRNLTHVLRLGENSRAEPVVLLVHYLEVQSRSQQRLLSSIRLMLRDRDSLSTAVTLSVTLINSLNMLLNVNGTQEREDLKPRSKVDLGNPDVGL